MNQLERIKIALSLIAVLALSSCIKEDPDDCKINVSFDYSYNILSSNALEKQVDELMLYVFDESGMLVSKHAPAAGVISHTLTVEMIKPEVSGKYSFVAWARSNKVSGNAAQFDVPNLQVGSSHIDELTYHLKREHAVSTHELNNLLVGVAEANIQNVPGTDEVIVHLKKVTNKIRVVLLPYLAGSDLDVANYNFSITEPVGNGRINYDYNLLTDEPLTYLPYYQANIRPEAGTSVPSDEVDKAAVAEFSLSRLMESHAPRLRISAANDGQDLANINLPWLFSLTEMESHRHWSLQEYLDRQDEYVITLFFDEDKWMDATIIINGWVVNNISINP